MGRSRRVVYFLAAFELCAIAICARPTDAAPLGKLLGGGAEEVDDGPVLAPPMVEVPGGVAPTQPAPFREAPVPTWSPAQAAVNAQQRSQAPPQSQFPPQTQLPPQTQFPQQAPPAGRAAPQYGLPPAYGTAPRAPGGYNNAPAVDPSTRQPSMDLKRTRTLPPGKTSAPPVGRTPAPTTGKLGYPAAGAKAAKAPAGGANPGAIDPLTGRKTTRWNPFSKQEKTPMTQQPAGGAKGFGAFKSKAPPREEAPLYQYGSGAQTPMPPSVPPAGPNQKTTRWPWSK